MKLKFGVFFDPAYLPTTFSSIEKLALEAEKLGYESLWISDHLMEGNKPIIECFTTLSSLASLTKMIRLGSLVTCHSYRRPSLLAKMGATIDVISNGRFELGLGAGWDRTEYHGYGFPFPKPRIRIAQMTEGISIIKQFWNSLNLIDTYLGLILIEVIFSTAYAVIILRSFFERIPRELLDAARVEGCSDISLYWKIIMPLSIPALISAFVIEFVYIWNDFLWPLILAPSTGVQPMTLAILRMAGTHAVAWNLRAAAAIVASLPPLILFVVLQKYFIRGILGGAVIKK